MTQARLSEEWMDPETRVSKEEQLTFSFGKKEKQVSVAGRKTHGVMEDVGFGVRLAWVRILAKLLLSWAALDRLFIHS